MAETAALYAVSTVAEGAVVGGLAVSQSTVPLRVRFHKVHAPSAALALQKATISVIKSKAYIIGGDPKEGQVSDGIHVLSLPLDFGSSRVDVNTPIDSDYKFIQPQPEKDGTLHEDSQPQHGLWNRGAHSATTIGSKIFVFGGRPSNIRETGPSYLYEILCFDTARSTYSLLSADTKNDTEEVPEPRTVASLTSSSFPSHSDVTTSPDVIAAIEDHGTIFLHGGYDGQHQPLHDTWTFDVQTRTWHKFPSLPDEILVGLKTPGRINYSNSKLWYTNGQTAAYLELAEHQSRSDEDASNVSNSSKGRVGSGQWIIVASPQTSVLEAEKTTPNAYFSLLPITTGAGREYLITFPRKNPLELHSFQLQSESSTLSAVKDAVRDLKSMPHSWRSGKHEWAACEIVRADKDDGPLTLPSSDLTDYAIAPWDEYGDRLIMWGGQDANGEPSKEGWVVNLE